jgi:hypothetical protein
MRTLKQPIKVIDNFFEAPELWRHYGLQQEFTKDENSTWPGTRTTTLDQLDMNDEIINNFVNRFIDGFLNCMNIDDKFN